MMLLNARGVFDEDGSASAILLAIEDVTRRREVEREKGRADSMHPQTRLSSSDCPATKRVKI